MAYASGVTLLFALAFTMAAIYAQITVNDLVIARYTADAWRGRVYAVRYFLTFMISGVAVSMIALLYGRGGFGLVLGVTAFVAFGFLLAGSRSPDRQQASRRRRSRSGAGGVGALADLLLSNLARRLSRTSPPEAARGLARRRRRARTRLVASHITARAATSHNAPTQPRLVSEPRNSVSEPNAAPSEKPIT